MNQTEFNERIKKIENYYEKELNEVQLDAWLDSLISMNIAQFDYLIKNIFMNFTYMPKLAQILELKNQLLFEFKKQNEQNFEKDECSKCKSLGVIRYYRTTDGNKYDFFARCICKNALKYKSFPVITDIVNEERAKGQKITTTKKVIPTDKKDVRTYLSQIGFNINEK